MRFECQLLPLTRVVLAMHWKLPLGELQSMKQERDINTDLTALHGWRSVCRSLYWIPHGPCTLHFKPILGNTSWDYVSNEGRTTALKYVTVQTLPVSSHLFHLQTGLSYSTQRHLVWRGYRKIRQHILSISRISLKFVPQNWKIPPVCRALSLQK